MIARQYLGNAAVDLFAATERLPVEVVHADPQAAVGRGHVCGHLTTSHRMTS